MSLIDVAGERERVLFHSGLFGFGASLLITVFVSDFLYWQTSLFQWNNFSGWLLLAGLIFAALAAIAFFVDLLSRRIARVSWPRFFAVAVAALLSLLNVFVHSRDAYTAVVPEGIILSAIVALILIVVGAGGWRLASARRILSPSRF
jgi:uncharacterized membrane protein